MSKQNDEFYESKTQLKVTKNEISEKNIISRVFFSFHAFILKAKSKQTDISLICQATAEFILAFPNI